MSLINDILDFSKIEAGQLEIEVVEFEVRPVIDQVLPMEKARDGFAAMAGGDVFGKIVFTR